MLIARCMFLTLIDNGSGPTDRPRLEVEDESYFALLIDLRPRPQR